MYSGNTEIGTSVVSLIVSAKFGELLKLSIVMLLTGSSVPRVGKNPGVFFRKLPPCSGFYQAYSFFVNSDTEYL